MTGRSIYHNAGDNFLYQRTSALVQTNTALYIRRHSASASSSLVMLVYGKNYNAVTDIVLVEKHRQLTHGNSKVGLVELVRNVPPEWTELASLLDQGVEEAKSEEHPFPRSLNIITACFVNELAAFLGITRQS